MEEYTPSVIEPTFGIGRIMYAMLEHNFKIRSEDNQRKVNILFLNLFPKIYFMILVFYIITIDRAI